MQYSLFGSLLTVGAMIGAITSGPIADYIGRKGAMRFSSTFCVAGWLAIYFAELMVATGVSAAFIMGTVLRWRVLALTGLIPCVILHVGLFLIPESPRWLAKKGREKESETTLQKLRGRDADISYEAIEIKIGVGLMVLQQFGGINAVCFYASSIFEVAGFSPSVGTIIYAILQVVVVFLSTTIIDKVGRKPLLLASASGLVISCLITGLSFYLKIHELALKSVPMLAVTGILIFPLNIKGVAGSVATLVNWFCAWAVSFTFNLLFSWSSYGTFILYAAINAVTIVFVVLLVPETKGRTLEQIQAAIR
ncbi:hypothetical protein DKX38_021344 [Salix brachista]|uniref:Major facilitator superfamily (MFS) profile domain-containing protein n=1 Tax=Salix brachista TaxID=2182728 RepID=A0A5N5KDJ2_9ROSI|nr:hypothetical protein DKX38_021344 [Salix brachista]